MESMEEDLVAESSRSEDDIAQGRLVQADC